MNNNNNSTICSSRKYPYSTPVGFLLVWALPTPPSLVLHVSETPPPVPQDFSVTLQGLGTNIFQNQKMLTTKHHTCFSYHLNKVLSKEGKLYSATMCSELSSWNTPIRQDTNQKRIIYNPTSCDHFSCHGGGALKFQGGSEKKGVSRF